MSETVKFTKEQLAQRLGFSTRQLELLVQRKDFPAGERRGRQLFWVELVVEAWELRQFAEQRAWAAAVTREANVN
jgi:predicted DNA-binding transcriptional regulator AlpA